ncbi:tetratricopeptide repeat protein 27-like [Thalassophryne amazonica]|uniref:tetratricopeptide repeat protein 27-like n=1 Tax=Thalassophryne amazonica TaxID=390379 RepID=UPI001471DFA0|nr:tetratricopeptide repeat protein 27-like [Thalassophryne amazonica]
MLPDVELCVLRGFFTATEAAEWKQNITSEEVGSLLQSLMEGDFKAVLLSPQVLDLLTGDITCNSGENIEDFLERRVLLYLNTVPNDNAATREVVLMVVAVACLHMFAQSNWTGPPITFSVPDLLPTGLLSSQPENLDEAFQASLLLDGESVYSLVVNPFLLLLARVILVKCFKKMDSLQFVSWWTLRYISLHQQILEARSAQLLSLAQICMDSGKDVLLKLCKAN